MTRHDDEIADGLRIAGVVIAVGLSVIAVAVIGTVELLRWVGLR